MYQLHSLFLVESNQRHVHLWPTKEYPRNLGISFFLYLPFLSSSVNKKIKHDVRIKKYVQFSAHDPLHQSRNTLINRRAK